MCGNVEIIETPAPESGAGVLAKAQWSWMDVQHRVEAGIYTRQGKIAAGTLILGAKHRAANIFHLSRGKIVVWDRFRGRRVLEAPFSEMTLPGTQRVGFALTEVEGCNIFATEKTDVDEIEREMLEPFNQVEAIKEIGEEIFKGVICEAANKQSQQALPG